MVLCWSLWTTSLLRENAALCKQVVTIQETWCQGIQDVNVVCEETIVDVAGRLGLDTEWMPLVTTALWRRASGGAGIRKARETMGAPAWQREPPLGSGIGGGTDEDERLLSGGK